jgi:hypothetical protein
MGALLALGLAPIHLRRGWTAVAATVIFIVVALAAVSAAAGFRALLARMRSTDQLRLFGGRVAVALPSLDRELHTFEAVLALVRQLGLALPALVFFCGWALIYALIWAHAPQACSLDLTRPCHGAFQGAGVRPTFGDFLYVSVNLAFANPPPDLLTHSRLAHMAATVEVISGVALVTLYATSFFGLASRLDGTTPAGRAALARERSAGGPGSVSGEDQAEPKGADADDEHGADPGQ